MAESERSYTEAEKSAASNASDAPLSLSPEHDTIHPLSPSSTLLTLQTNHCSGSSSSSNSVDDSHSDSSNNSLDSGDTEEIRQWYMNSLSRSHLYLQMQENVGYLNADAARAISQSTANIATTTKSSSSEQHSSPLSVTGECVLSQDVITFLSPLSTGSSLVEKAIFDTSTLDRFGFFQSDIFRHQTSSLSARSLPPLFRSRVKKEMQRSMKWIRMLKKLEGVPLTSAWPRTHPKFERRLHKGIPDCLRSKVWSLMLNSFPHSIDPNVSFLDLYNKPSFYERQIDLDVERTLRNHILFRLRYGAGQISLFKVLVALANYMPEVGYCQGMSSVAAFFLLYFDEETAFKNLLYLFDSQKLGSLYIHHFPKLFETFYIFEKLLDYYYPRISKHLKRLGIKCELYATKWFLTLFLNLPFPVATRLWDIFLFYGFDILIHAGLGLLYYFEDVIISSDYESVMEFLSRIDENYIDPDKYVKTIKKSWKNSRYNIRRLRQLYNNSSTGKELSNSI